MADIGKYYIEVVPRAKGITSKLEGVLRQPAQAASTKVGSMMGPVIANGMKSIGTGMTNFITKPALAAVTALGGATLFSGWKRMTEIDNAKVKLEAIGNTTKDVAKIQQNAMEAVKGTAYGMNEAMTTSAAAVAAGIQPGEELTQYLTAISDAAAVAGTGMASMGSIFNKVATSGKAQNDVLNQLADQGIPIYQYLADQMGVTADKVFEMASAGEIGLSDFQAAVQNHIGSAAKEIGSNTITGAISNVRAAISRIGANFLGSADDADSFAGKVLPVLNNLMTNLEPLEEKAKELGSRFADGFQALADAIGKIPLPVLAGIGGALVTIGPALKIVGTAMTLAGPAFTMLSTVLGSSAAAAIMSCVSPLLALGAVLVAAWTQSETFRSAVINLVTELGRQLAPVLTAAGGFFKVFVAEIMRTAQAIGNALAPVLKLLTPVLSLVAKWVGVKLKAAFAVLGAVVRTAGAIIRAGAAIIQGAVTGISKIFSSAWGPIRAFGTRVASVLSFKGLVGRVKGIFNSIKTAITHPIDTAKSLVGKAIDAIKGLFPLNVGKILSAIKLPHFSVSGGKAPWGVGGLGSMPKFSVKWFAKGGIMEQPTLFGGGEAGSEAIVPLDPFWDKLDEINNSPRQVIMNFNVNGAENPEQWAGRAARKLKIEMRSL